MPGVESAPRTSADSASAVTRAIRLPKTAVPLPSSPRMATADPAKLSPLQVKRALNRNILAGSFGVLFATCLSLQFVTHFALQMGANEFQLGLLTSLPLLCYPLQLVFALQMGANEF